MIVPPDEMLKFVPVIWLPVPFGVIARAVALVVLGVSVCAPVNELLALSRAKFDWSMPMVADVDVPVLVIGAVTPMTPDEPCAPIEPATVKVQPVHEVAP